MLMEEKKVKQNFELSGNKNPITQKSECREEYYRNSSDEP